jgi:uncharacterized protein (TIGR02246 family)
MTVTRGLKMSTNPGTIAIRSSACVTSAAPVVHRIHRIAIASAMLATGLLLVGCDGAAPTPADPTAPNASVANASVANAFDHVGPQHGDEAAVAGIAAAWDAAWNAGDAGGIAALFVDDAEFINGRGQIAQGAATIYAQHAASLAGVFNGSHTHGTVRGIAFLSGTTAVLDVDNTLTGFKALPPGTVATEPGVQRGRHKRVVVKRAGVWRILQMQITTIAPTP